MKKYDNGVEILFGSCTRCLAIASPSIIAMVERIEPEITAKIKFPVQELKVLYQPYPTSQENIMHTPNAAISGIFEDLFCILRIT